MHNTQVRTLRDSQPAYRYAISLLKTHEIRLHWSRETIQREKLRRIKILIDYCKKYSEWHKKRLKNIEVNEITLENFNSIPIMTKQDLMKNWDEIVTDKTLTLKKIEDGIDNANLSSEISNEYNFVITGGSSGIRGVFVYNLEEWAHCYCASVRSFIKVFNTLSSNDNHITKVTIAAPLSNHMTSNLTQNFFNLKIKEYYLPVTHNLKDIVKSLNSLQPMFLQGYPSILTCLAEEQSLKRLRIQPKMITSMGEPLYDHHKKMINKAWNCNIFNVWACGEAGVLGMNCLNSSYLHLCEDMHYIESSHSNDKILLTNLFSKTLPLIRYEIDDAITLLDQPCSCGLNFQLVKEVRGRASDNFIYPDNIVVHSILFRSILNKYSILSEFQIKQIKNGVEVYLKSAINIDSKIINEINEQIKESLFRVGLIEPIVNTFQVSELKKTISGKINRYISF